MFVCLFYYYYYFFAIHISLLFLLTFSAIRIFFFHPHFSIRIFPSASAIRRYPVRVLQTPFGKLVAGKKSEKNNLCQQLKSEEKEKQITGQRLRDQERQLQDLQMAQQRSIELNDKLMRTCHVMTKIWGKSQELNNEARRAYSLEPLLTPIKEIVDMFTPEEQKEIKQNTFLLSKEIDFSSITWKLKAVCDANADSSIMAILDEYC